MSGRSAGTCCIVLHSHLPWLAHTGAWPVGEEWLYQAWASSYLPVLDVLDRLAEAGGRDLLTLGVTPVLAAMLDDPYCLTEFHTWLGNWLLRAAGAAADGLEVAGYEGALATRALDLFESGWRHGASPLLRRLRDGGVVELLGGPATHGFTPLLPERIAEGGIRAGLEDAAVRLGLRPSGVWAPECAYAPGQERLWQRAGVTHLVVDGPAVHGETGFPVDVAGSGLLAFPRDLSVTYRVWSPRSGYPGGRWYRDFHTFDHPSGLHPARVTSRSLPPERKAGYQPAAARAAVERDAEDFVALVRRRLDAAHRPGLVLVAYDTELFGHWWHEGPQWLERVLQLLPRAGVRLSSLRAAAEELPAIRRDLPASSWGSGKDWRVWQVPEILDVQNEVCGLLLAAVDRRVPAGPGGCLPVRDPVLDQLARECLLTVASDWAFSVTKGSAADFAWRQLRVHADRARALAGELSSAAFPGAESPSLDGQGVRWRAVDGLLGALDAQAAFAPR